MAETFKIGKLVIIMREQGTIWSGELVTLWVKGRFSKREGN